MPAPARGRGSALRAHGDVSLRGRSEFAVPGQVSRGGRGDARGGRLGRVRGRAEDRPAVGVLAEARRHGGEGGEGGQAGAFAVRGCPARGAEAGAVGRAPQTGWLLREESERAVDRGLVQQRGV